MNKKTGRNDPCPCGSGKKYKSCCLLTEKKPAGKKKFTAKLLNTPTAANPAPINLIERTFGPAIEAAEKNEPVKPFKKVTATTNPPLEQ